LNGIPFDSGNIVSKEHETSGTFKGGTIPFVEITVEKPRNLDLAMKLNRSIRDCLEGTWYVARLKHVRKLVRREKRP